MRIKKEYWALSKEALEALEALKQAGIEDEDLAIEVLEKLWPVEVVYELERF